MEQGNILLVAVVLAMSIVLGSLVVMVTRDVRRSPIERHARSQTWVQLDVLQDLQRAFARAEALDNVNLVAIFEQALTGAKGEPLDATDVETLRSRLEAIETRLPNDATVDKIASANEAVLGVKVETLERQVQELRTDLLTRYDVVLVLFAVLGGIGALAALAGFVIRNF